MLRLTVSIGPSSAFEGGFITCEVPRGSKLSAESLLLMQACPPLKAPRDSESLTDERGEDGSKVKNIEVGGDNCDRGECDGSKGDDGISGDVKGDNSGDTDSNRTEGDNKTGNEGAEGDVNNSKCNNSDGNDGEDGEDDGKDGEDDGKDGNAGNDSDSNHGEDRDGDSSVNAMGWGAEDIDESKLQSGASVEGKKSMLLTRRVVAGQKPLHYQGFCDARDEW